MGSNYMKNIPSNEDLLWDSQKEKAKDKSDIKSTIKYFTLLTLNLLANLVEILVAVNDSGLGSEAASGSNLIRLG